MSFGEYVRSQGVTLCFLGIGGLLLAVFLLFGGAEIALLAAAEGCFLLVVLCWLAGSFCAACRQLRQLQQLTQGLEDAYLLGELLPPPTGAVQRQYYRVMRAVSRSAIDRVQAAQREKEDYCQYVESWVHEMKTPLTACSLILANGGDRDKLRRELRRADNLTESILYYARLRSADRDRVVRPFSVAAVMGEAVKSQMELLIAAGISVTVQGDFTAHGDDKQLTFVLGQLLVNCAKYCPGGKVALTAAAGTVTVRDNGPGIADYELRRVTERGFTGRAGRALGGSTGMGLYIADQLCRQSDMQLTVSSRLGEGTAVRITYSNLTKL